jgi:hypothetical protein
VAKTSKDSRRIVAERTSGGWAVRGSKSKGAYKTKAAAKRFTLGREAFAQISAIEGLHLTLEMKRDFQRFDEERLPNRNRRGAIVAKYGVKAP